MTDNMVRCARCSGRKRMFKMGPIYSHTNTGGVEVECPMCLGKGEVLTMVKALEEVKAKRKYTTKAKELNDEKKDTEERSITSSEA